MSQEQTLLFKDREVSLCDAYMILNRFLQHLSHQCFCNFIYAMGNQPFHQDILHILFYQLLKNCWYNFWTSEFHSVVNKIRVYFRLHDMRHWTFFLTNIWDNRPDDGGSQYFWNVVRLLPDYTVQKSRRQQSSCSQVWELKSLSHLYYMFIECWVGICVIINDTHNYAAMYGDRSRNKYVGRLLA